MSEKEAFGPNLRRTRMRRSVTLEQIAAQTKVGVGLWEAMERNDFGAWPPGIFARAYIRAYAVAVGLDPDTTVDEFCRFFPQGDRRAGATMRGQAEIVGHNLDWKDQVPPSIMGGDRRAGEAPMSPDSPGEPRRLASVGQVFGRLLRVFGRA